MRDVYRNPFTFFYRNVLSTSQRVRFETILPTEQKKTLSSAKHVIKIHHFSPSRDIQQNIWSESKSFSITRVVDDDDESDVEVDDFPLMNEKPYWVLAQTKLKAWLSPAAISLSDEEQI